MRYNLGSGSVPIDGYENWDIKNGHLAYPLDIPDGSADEIRASHLLEHYGHHEVFNVVSHWVGKLRTGGVLKIAVPDFAEICKRYQAKENDNLAYYLMGAQSDEYNYHKAVFDEDSLSEIMEKAGLADITRWDSADADCASLPISLNLQGIKGTSLSAGVSRKLSAVMSMPRLAFTDNLTCVMRHVIAKGIPLKRSSGVFWGQCLTRLIESELKEDSDYIMTIDYDTWFDYKDIVSLCQVLEDHPEYDAVMPVQCKRENDSPLVGIKDPTGQRREYITTDFFEGKDVVEAHTGHFGLTVFRRGCFAKIQKPWFLPKPDPTGGWNDGRVDEDITFWHNFEAAGLKLGLAPKVKVGHLELVVTFPGKLEDAWKPEFHRVSEFDDKH